MQLHKPRKPISKGVRFDVLTRDGFKCFYCGATPPNVVLHVDHIHPVAQGGGNNLSNLRTACLPCNLGKSAKVIPDVRRMVVAQNIKRPEIEFFWRYEDRAPFRVIEARCVRWIPDTIPYGGDEYSSLCADYRFSTHGHSGAGFSPYEASMYAVDILVKKWVSFSAYIAFIDDLNMAAETGHLPQYTAPHVLRALDAATAAGRCDQRPASYADLVDSIAEQSVAAFQPFIDAQHSPWAR